MARDSFPDTSNSMARLPDGQLRRPAADTPLVKPSDGLCGSWWRGGLDAGLGLGLH